MKEFGKKSESGMKAKALKRGSERGCNFADVVLLTGLLVRRREWLTSGMHL